MLDILIKNGRIINGTGNPWFKGDVAIQDGRIAKIGHISKSEAKKTIDAEKLIVSPGFIDIHSHSDIIWLARPTADEKILQGVTTELIGQCGFSVAPIKEECKEEYKQLVMGVLGNTIPWNWNTLTEYLAVFEFQGIAVNIASSVGHGIIRFCAMGMENRSPTSDEMNEMKQNVAQCFEEGAFAFSTGLIYPPLTFATTEEIIELCKVAAHHDGFLSIHMRNESDKVIESVHEVIKIGKETGIPIEISHFKAAGKQNWGKVAQTLKLVEDAREMDIDITVDQYPYTAGSTTLTAILPPWVHVGGKNELLQRLKNRETREQIKQEIEKEGADWDNYAKASGWDGILITSVKTEQNKDLEGKTLSEIAEIKGVEDPAEAAFDLIIEEEAAVSMVLFFMDENDVTTVLSHSLQMVGTDSIIIGKYHPRAIASYPKILRQYVREKEVLTLPEAIRKMTSLPAQKIGLEDRGLLLPGFAADIIIFDAKTISDTATYVDPHQFPKGIEFVIVNGEPVVEERKHTGALPGKVLRKTDYL
ncbi:MAG: amidohydrolase family protein [Promethearchaeota archaeon]